MNRRRNLILVACGLAVVVLLGIYGAVRPRGPTVDAKVDTVKVGDFMTTLPETGVVQRPRSVVLPTLVGGNIGTIGVHAGQRIAKGDVIATIVNPQVNSALQTAQAAYDAAQGRAQSAVETNAALPAQNRSSVVQAQANLQQAIVGLQQAQQDYASGQQSGLGYGGSTADDQRVAADTAVAKADTDLREAQREYDADLDLFTQKAISRDALDQSKARLDEARASDQQAHRQRGNLIGQLGREQPLLRNRVAAAEEAVTQARSALAAAQAAAAESHAGDVGAAQGDAARAAEELRYARDQVARLTIRAPFDGIVETISTEATDSLRPLQPGDAVQPGEAVATIAGDSAFVVRTKVDEQDISAIEIGQTAHVSGEDLGSKTLRGHVSQISAVAQRSDDPSNTSRQVITTVALDETLPFLRDGMTVDVDIATKQVRNVIVVSNDAIHKGDDGKPYVYVVRDGRARKTPVVTGSSNDASTIVRHGLAAGDQVVADRNPAVVDGAYVKPLPAPTPSP